MQSVNASSTLYVSIFLKARQNTTNLAVSRVEGFHDGLFVSLFLKLQKKMQACISLKNGPGKELLVSLVDIAINLGNEERSVSICAHT